MEYKYNELEYAKLINFNGFQTKHIPTELRLLAVYYRDILELKPKERREKLYSFCEEYIPNYNRAKHFKMINKALQQATNKTNKLITINKIDIYQNEVDFINSIDLSDNHKKVLFALLVHKKLSKLVYEIKNADNQDKKEYNMLFFKGGNKVYNNIKKIANIPTTVKINDDIIYDLSNHLLYDKKNKKYNNDNPEHLVTVLHNGLILLNYINECDETGDVVIEIKDFENVGWYLDYYNGINKVILCKHCNQPFKQTRNNILYCKKHQGYIKQENKTITCIDCNKEVVVDAWDMKTCRCEECQKEHNKKRKREWKRQNREKYLKK